MKIYFCDGCNESIPLGDIQAGQATTIKGKLFCRNCIPLGVTQPAGAPAAPAARGTHPLFVLLLVGLLGYVLWRDVPWLRGDVERPATSGADPEIARRLELLEEDFGDLAQASDALGEQIEFRRTDIDALQSARNELGRGIDEIRRDMVRLSRGQADIGQLIEKLNLVENRSDVIENRLNVIADRVYAHDKRFEMGAVAASGRMGGGDDMGATPGGVSSPAAAAVDPTRAAELEALRRLLLDPNPGQRFDAVHRIGQGRYKELSAELLEVFDDEDPFVRERAMTVLGDFGFTDAVPALLDVLDDPLVTIRRTAFETLVRLTGYDPEYDPAGGKGERDRAVQRWRKWLDDRA